MKLLIASLVLVTVLPAIQVRAADGSPMLILMMRSHQENQLRDGAVIGSGRVTFQGPHSGFRVWLEADKSGAAPERYELTGKNNAAHRLKVRLAGEGWGADRADSHNGVSMLTGKEQVSVNIVVDGNQDVAADRYIITAKSAAMTP